MIWPCLTTSQPHRPPRLTSGPESFDLAWESEQPDEDFWEAEKPDVTLDNVAGMVEVKRRLNLAFLGPLKNPEMMRMYGKSLRGGLLMYGPPGCGKTFIARATAGELGAKFISVGLSDVLDMWIGASEKNLHEIFETARRNAPCVLFFDEIDALGQKRSLQRHSAARNVVNQLLSEMDSVDANNEGIFVLAATNHPWDVDTALRRPGRLDRTLLVLPPDVAARNAILQWHVRERPLDKLDFGWLAEKTTEYSGADLVHLVDSAAELALEDSITNGRARPIGMADFKKMLKEIKPSTRSWFEVARNYAMFANDGGVYDELLEYLRIHKII
jgi:SpoVK/Ycf46/Vps4 family AAA+-type ATPase